MSSGNEFQRMMLRQERNDDRRLIDGMMKRAVDVMTMSEVGDDRACLRCEPADSGKVRGMRPFSIY